MGALSHHSIVELGVILETLKVTLSSNAHTRAQGWQVIV